MNVTVSSAVARLTSGRAPSVDYADFNLGTDLETAVHEQARNRAFLRAGVEGVQCLYAGPADKAPLTREQSYAVVSVISNRLFPDEALGTVEVYANGALNVFGRTGSGLGTRVFGAWAVRF